MSGARRAVGWVSQSAISRRAEQLVLASAIAGLAVTVTYALVHLTGEPRDYFLYYNVPIAAPFAAFVVERITTRSRPASYFVDAIVVALALARAFLPVPAYSGHVLFCTYAALSSRGVTLRVTSLLVLAEVLAIKLFLWRDLVTPVGGLAIAVVTWMIHRLASRDDCEGIAS